MYLSKGEERMLDGEFGSAVSGAMEILVKLGDAYKAERMIPVSGAHVFAWKISGDLPGNVVLERIQKMTEGTKLRVPCTTNPLTLNPDLSEKLGIPEDILETHRENISKLINLTREIGAIPTYSCHYHYPYEPKLGDHYALTESNVCMFANAWYGIRSNMEGDITALASAITGKTPEYNLHLTENRYGQVLVKLSSDLDPREFSNTDFGALSYYTGEIIGSDRIPVYEGFPRDTSATQVKYMQPQIAHSSSTMFHIVGVTPEAPTLEAAFGGDKPEDKITIGKEELQESYERFNTTSEDRVDMVGIGCPHCTLEEIREIARLLTNKKVERNVRLLIGTSAAVKSLAEKMGLVGQIEAAGGIVLSDMCTMGPLLLGLIEKWNIRVAATNSSTAAGIRAEHPEFVPGIDVRFGNLEKCIQAAVSGRWVD
nr:aconitase X catalytic domain-containing protein [Candidatus Freyarchaeota archaeon]